MGTVLKKNIVQNSTMHPSFDPWETYIDVEEHADMVLSSVELTTTYLCNMRCEHCAVGYTLANRDPEALPLDLMIHSLDQVPHLRTLSITGGEPMLSVQSVQNVVLPILRYARQRGVRTQINSNLTLDTKRYEWIAPYVDVLHITHNYGSVEDFAEIGFAVMDKKPSYAQREKLFHHMVENAQLLSAQGVMVSAETMINRRTLPHLESIHRQVIEMGCTRHEVHPMYPSDFASSLEVATLPEIREGIQRLLDARQEDVWMLFGTLPFYPCSAEEEDIALYEKLYRAPNVTVRNDPDGRCRLNVNIFDGNITVTDFSDMSSLGNIQMNTLPDVYAHWRSSSAAKRLNCHCPAVQCLGPNALVKHTYYPDTDFQERRAHPSLEKAFQQTLTKLENDHVITEQKDQNYCSDTLKGE